MNIAVIDDEKIYQDELDLIIKEEFTKFGVNSLDIRNFDSAEDFLDLWIPNTFDLIFIDIYMPGINGVELGKRIREKDENVKLVFATTSNEFAAESYTVRASYYLRKPYDRNEIKKMLSQRSIFPKDVVEIEFDDGWRRPIDSIIFTEYENHRITLYMEDGEKHSERLAQKKLVELLSGHQEFIQINQGMMVNLSFVDHIGKWLVLKNGISLPFSRRLKNNILDAYADFKLMQYRSS